VCQLFNFLFTQCNSSNKGVTNSGFFPDKQIYCCNVKNNIVWQQGFNLHGTGIPGAFISHIPAG